MGKAETVNQEIRNSPSWRFNLLKCKKKELRIRVSKTSILSQFHFVVGHIAQRSLSKKYFVKFLEAQQFLLLRRKKKNENTSSLKRRSFVWIIKRLFSLVSLFVYIYLRLISSHISFPFVHVTMQSCPADEMDNLPTFRLHLCALLHVNICVRRCINSEKINKKKELRCQWVNEVEKFRVEVHCCYWDETLNYRKFSEKKLEKRIWTFKLRVTRWFALFAPFTNLFIASDYATELSGRLKEIFYALSVLSDEMITEVDVGF